jgi:hypothetical protein
MASKSINIKIQIQLNQDVRLRKGLSIIYEIEILIIAEWFWPECKYLWQ